MSSNVGGAAFVCALVYPQFDHRTFSGLVAVLLALPWIDYLPSGRPFMLLVGCATLNAIIIYLVLAALVTFSIPFRSWQNISSQYSRTIRF